MPSADGWDRPSELAFHVVLGFTLGSTAAQSQDVFLHPPLQERGQPIGGLQSLKLLPNTTRGYIGKCFVAN